MAHLRKELITHTRKVCSLYKRACRTVEDTVHQLPAQRYNILLVRQRFEEHRNEKDMRKVKVLLEAAEEELRQAAHYQPKKFANSPGGVCYERNFPAPDWVLDYWHPLEKAQYPEYFARREARKKEYVQNWEKEYGKPGRQASSH